MSITVNLWTRKTGELKKFLERFYLKKLNMDEDTDSWAYVYNKPVEAVDIICAVMDNSDRYRISVFIQINDGDIYPVTAENYNNVIKDIFHLFFKDSVKSNCTY